MPDPPSSSARPPAAAPSAFVRSVTGSVLLSLVVLGVIAYFTFEAAAFRQMLRTLNPWLLGGALGLTALRVLLGGWRLCYVSRGRLRLMEGIRGQLAWEFFSNVTPSAIGGGPIAPVYVARDRGITVGEASAFLLFCMLLDQFWFILSIPLILAAALYVEVIPPSVGTVGAWTFLAYFAGLMAWASLFAYTTFFRPRLLRRLANRVFSLRFFRRFRRRVLRELDQLSRRALTLRSQPPAFYLKGFLLTVGLWAARYSLVLFIVWSVYASVDKLLIVLRTAALMMSSVILPTPGGAGGLEGLYALLIGPLMPKALVAPTLLAWRLLGYYLFIALGVYLSTHQVRQTLHRRKSGDAPHEKTRRPLPHDAPAS